MILVLVLEMRAVAILYARSVVLNEVAQANAHVIYQHFD